MRNIFSKEKIVLSMVVAVSLILCSNLSAFSFVACPESNETPLTDVGLYQVESNQNPNQAFFSSAILFAANIHGSIDNPTVYYNTADQAILNSGQIAELKAKNINSQICYMPDHQAAGWSSLVSPQAAEQLANEMVNDVVKYGADGINIDNEWCSGASNDYSMTMIAYYIKNNPNFRGKILTINLTGTSLLNETWTPPGQTKPVVLKDYIDDVYSMNYGEGADSLQQYVNAGISKNNVYLGVEAGDQNVSTDVKDLINDGYGGMMMYDIDDSSGSGDSTQWIQTAGSAAGMNVIKT
ncbi:MAG TPA: hypothetical protein QF753_02525 [Victivallales bacterium]|nr:hypothetical protein [Victivallales bacterium]